MEAETMKNALVIAGVFVGAVLAATLAWAVFGGSGGSRKAALQEPTQAGSIGELTIAGLRGEPIPVRSFNWHRTDSDSFRSIEVLRDGGASSPELFNFRTAALTAPSVTLDLLEPRGSGPYLRYQLTNARLAAYRSGTLEKLVLRSYVGGEVTHGRSAAPEPDPSDIVGHMMLGEDRVPILAFESGLLDSGGWFEAVIRRPIDQLAGRLNEAVDEPAGSLGTVTIELQAPGEAGRRVTYELSGNVRVRSLTDSVAAGVSPTEEVTIHSRRMRVTSGDGSACYDNTTQGTC